MMKLNVLIVEDSFYSADLNIRELKKAGFDVRHQVVASKRAMQKALEEAPWDIILSDNSMPGFDALQAIETRNIYAAETPFAIVSEDISEIDIRRAKALGCSDYISKASLSVLGQKVKEILEIEAARYQKDICFSCNYKEEHNVTHE
jgi:two-component system sensor histidine kinase UhpB